MRTSDRPVRRESPKPTTAAHATRRTRAEAVWPGTQGWQRFIARAARGIEKLYAWRMGWLFGHRLTVITHTGRVSGVTYRTVLYVQHYDRTTSTVTVVSVWGDCDWYRNIVQRPAALVETGRERFVPQQRFLSTDELTDIELQFRQRSPVVARAQARIMGWPWPATSAQLREMATRMRGVAFTPRRPGRW